MRFPLFLRVGSTIASPASTQRQTSRTHLSCSEATRHLSFRAPPSPSRKALRSATMTAALKSAGHSKTGRRLTRTGLRPFSGPGFAASMGLARSRSVLAQLLTPRAGTTSEPQVASLFPRLGCSRPTTSTEATLAPAVSSPLSATHSRRLLRSTSSTATAPQFSLEQSASLKRARLTGPATASFQPPASTSSPCLRVAARLCRATTRLAWSTTPLFWV